MKYLLEKTKVLREESMPLFDHFSILAPLYDVAIPLGDLKAFIQRAALPTGGWLLDVGGGTGRVAYALRRQASHLVVADVAWGMLQQAAAKGGLHVVNGAAEVLPFPSHTFERAVMVDALHHVADQALAVRELWRVLKPGGRIVIEEPDVRTLIVKLVALGEKLALMRSHFLAPPRIVSLFPPGYAQARIETERYNAWVIVEKPAG
ncbi:MAG: class I SAM-dependent methyltransferase [Chloroflexota bacterium]